MIEMFRSTKDWKKELPREDEKKLNKIIKKVEKYKRAYMLANNVKVAQLWCYVIEAESGMEELDKRIKKLEYLLGGFVERVKDQEFSKFEEKKDFKELRRSLETF